MVGGLKDTIKVDKQLQWGLRKKAVLLSSSVDQSLRSY